LSLLCFLGGIGVGFFVFFAGVGMGGVVGHMVMFVAMALALIAWLIGLIFGVHGVFRRERPLGPSILGVLLVGGIVVFLLMPTRSGPRGKAPRAQCVANERQILVAMAMYADANGGRLPVDSSTNPTLVGSLQLLSNIVPTAKILHCPEDQRPGAWAEEDFQKLTPLNISYSYVPNLKWQDTPDSPVIMDRIYSTTNGSSWPAAGNHRGQGGVVGFNDGHAQWCTVLPVDLKDKNGRQVVLTP
jgi:hypothetical protein